MNRISVLKSLRPKPLAPCYGESLCKLFARIAKPCRRSMQVDGLQVPQFVKEDTIEQKTAQRELAPLTASDSAKTLGILAS